MVAILGVQTKFPEHRYGQKDIMKLLSTMWPDHTAVLERLVSTSGVDYRNLILPLDRYQELGGFESRNGIYLEKVLVLLEQAVKGLHDKYPFNWNDLGLLVSTSVTGIAVPSLDARLMNKLPIPHDIVRMPLFGLGCLGGIASLNRAKDFLKAYPQKLALVIAAEACSLTFQFQDETMSNMVACSLFGDGAAAVVLAGEDHPLSKNAPLKMVDSMASFYPNTERIMGWDMLNSGFKVVLSGNVPDIVQKYVGDDVKGFLERNSLTLDEVNNLISHPGGPKVLKALAQTLGKDESLLAHSWKSLSEQGNMSSVSVLNVLERSIEQKTLKNGYALALAMGPAFNSEMALIRVQA